MGEKDGRDGGRGLGLLYATFCVYLVGEILFLSGKSQGILHTVTTMIKEMSCSNNI